MEKVSSGKIGRYEIIKVLGRGGMGEVILAQDENLGRRVAIKRPFKSAIAEGLARFQVEAKAATLRHPNIPAVYEMGVHDDLPFIAMEFVEGETLEKIIDSKREVDLITKLKIIEQVCSALGYAHENGIIHRDIKPANIIVQPDGVAKIIDFGIAKLQDDDPNSGLTKASQLIGSLHYIAPERFMGGPTDGRVDVFSAGVTLFKLLTGKEPFTGGEATASFKIMNESHQGLGAFLHDYPPALDEIVAKSLAKNPDDRYQTGEDFADALHEVIEELKRTRVTELFSDAERLTTERRFAPALELLDEAIKLDPSNTQARKLRKFVREHQERIRRAERLRECLLKSDEALLAGNFDEALTQLKDALNLDSESADIKAKIQSVEEKKRRFEISSRALAEAERVKARGDITGSQRIIAKALQEDPENKKLIAANAALVQQMEIEAQRGKLLELLEQATRALAARDYDAADKVLNEAAAIDPSNLETDKLRRELAKGRELEQRRAVLEEIQVRVQEFIKNDSYEQASDLLSRALDRLPNETMLHRLKAEVDTEARKYQTRRIVDGAIAQANELFTSSPFEALAVLQKALDQVPGEERLVAYERSLRQQLESQRSEQLRAQTVLKARELMDARQFDKAIGVLESYQVECGQQADIDQLLAFARNEQASQKRAETVSRSLSEGRALIREGRFDEAARLLEPAVQQTGDTALSGLLQEVREQQAAQARRFEALLKRVDVLRDRGDLDEAIQLLQEQLATAPGNDTLQKLSESLLAERKKKQVTGIALRAAREATKSNDFVAAMEALQTVVTAYGESAEVTQAIKDVERQRSTHAGETVGKSIESARAALLKKDSQGALEALKTATPFLQFADAQKQDEWQRIGQSVKKALQQAGSSATGVFDQQLSAIAQTKPRKIGLLVGVGACVMALAVVVVVVLMRPKPAPSVIEIDNVTAGAKVEVDGEVQTVGANNILQLKVKSGQHKVHISADGYKPLDKTVDVQGTTYAFDGTLIPAGVKTGNLLLALSGDLRKVNVTVDGKSQGDFGSNEPIPNLVVGAHAVTFSAPGHDTQTQSVTILEGNNTVPVSLPIVTVDQGTLTVHLQGDLKAVQLSANGKPQGQVHSDQKLTLPVGTYTLTYQAPGYKPGQSSGVRITKSSDTPVTISLEKPPATEPVGQLSATSTSIFHGDPVTLTWWTQNASTVEISGLGQVPPAGTRQVTPAGTTTYALTGNGKQLGDPVKIEVNDRPVLHPELLAFDVSPKSIERGQQITISWTVKNAASVDIPGVGSFGPSGSTQVSPAKSTNFSLMVGGQQLGQAQSVTVHEATPTPTPTPAGPDQATLEKALGVYKGVFAQASGKSSKDCQNAFNSALGGKLRDYSNWCPVAKSFSVSMQCTQVGGTPDSPTLVCNEAIKVVPKDGDPQTSSNHRVFHFAKGGDGNWQLTGW